MTDNLFIADHVFLIRVLTSLSVDKILLPRYVTVNSEFKKISQSYEFHQESHAKLEKIL